MDPKSGVNKDVKGKPTRAEEFYYTRTYIFPVKQHIELSLLMSYATEKREDLRRKNWVSLSFDVFKFFIPR